MSEWESPETQVRCSVWDCAQNELNGLDELVNESLIHIVSIMATFAFVLLIQEITVSFDVSLGTHYTCSLLLKSTFVSIIKRLAPHHDARFSAEHDWNANEYNNDQRFRDLLLTPEEENVCTWITNNKLLVTAS